jgi:hypothetical protein
MKNYFVMMLACLCYLSACADLRREQHLNDDSCHTDTVPKIMTSNYLNDIDEYVSFVRTNGEQLTFIRESTKKANKVISLLNNDTVRISVYGGGEFQETINVYYKNSEPLMLSRNCILDVDTSYLETAYFKNRRVYKCFRDGVELENADSIKLFNQLLATVSRS